MSSEQGKESFQASVEAMARQELEYLSVRRDEVASSLAEIDESLKSVRAVLRTVSPEPKKPVKPKGKKSTTQISASAREKFIDWATGREGDITAKQIQQALGVSDSYANMVAKQMREEGVLRLSSTHGSTNIYRSEV